LFFSDPRSSDNPSKLAGEAGNAKGNGDCKAGGDTGYTPVTKPNGVEKKNDTSATCPAEKGQVEAVQPDIGNGEGAVTMKTADSKEEEEKKKEEEEKKKKEEDEEEENVMTLDGIQLLFDIEAAELIPLIIRWVQEAGADHGSW